MSGNFIKLNLSDSSDKDDQELNKTINFPKVFSFKNSEDHGDKNSGMRSVIEEEKDEHNDSRNLISVHDSHNTLINRMNLLANSKSSPSLISSRGGGFLKNLMQSEEKRRIDIEDEENVFKRRVVKQSKNSEIEFLVSDHQSQVSNNRTNENNDIVPLSPDDKIRRKRRQRANEIANNPLMMRSSGKSKEKISSPAFSNEGGCIRMNLWFKKSEESEYNLEDSFHIPKRELDYSPYESIYKIEEREGNMKKVIENEAIKFDQKYSINNNVMLVDKDKPLVPTFSMIYDKIRQWTTCAKMESEIPVIALIYIEKLMKKSGVLMNEHNWSRLVMITLWIASKIWDDDSLENEHFAKVFNGISLKEISVLEKAFLGLIEYEVMITSKQFTKYSFILSTLWNSDLTRIASPKQIKNKVKRTEFESERLAYKYRDRTTKEKI